MSLTDEEPLSSNATVALLLIAGFAFVAAIAFVVKFILHVEFTKEDIYGDRPDQLESQHRRRASYIYQFPQDATATGEMKAGTSAHAPAHVTGGRLGRDVDPKVVKLLEDAGFI
ncbi:hypothetical protein D9758_016346 [Tetrapyrgos nigripes]|uniref:Uncharacterized protein n=1 Tax=Tetrapyrgos nigripes TaxID=182062 RepID=A0A8H5BZN6_9AGAR|nr:hypothetical protein D9758_016346 [Tetrapyrgos nigripes]